MAVLHTTVLSVAAMLFIWSATASDKVTVSVYYESLCPYSADFITNQLEDIFTDGLISIVDLRLIPFGNAKILDDGSIICQHGSYECLLNTVEACAIYAWPVVTEHFTFINCVEELVVEGTYRQWETCFDKLGLDSQLVLNCTAGADGKQLEYEYGDETDAALPQPRHVPSVVVNGKLLDEVNTLETAVCEAYTGELPEICKYLFFKQQKPRSSED